MKMEAEVAATRDCEDCQLSGKAQEAGKNSSLGTLKGI